MCDNVLVTIKAESPNDSTQSDNEYRDEKAERAALVMKFKLLQKAHERESRLRCPVAEASQAFLDLHL